MIERNINASLIHRHDSESNWNKLSNFVPKQGEIIVYDVDAKYSYERFKIGDGVTELNELPFSSPEVVADRGLVTSRNNQGIHIGLDESFEFIFDGGDYSSMLAKLEGYQTVKNEFFGETAYLDDEGTTYTITKNEFGGTTINIE